jgi:hypothetical protein
MATVEIAATIHTETTRIRFDVTGAPDMKQLWFGDQVFRPDMLTLVFERKNGSAWAFHQATFSGPRVPDPACSGWSVVADLVRSRREIPQWAASILDTELDRLNTTRRSDR